MAWAPRFLPRSRQGPCARAVLPLGSLGSPVTQSESKRVGAGWKREGRAPANKMRLIHHGFYEDLLIFFNL